MVTDNITDNIGMKLESKTWAAEIYTKLVSTLFLNLIRLWHSFRHVFWVRSEGNSTLIGDINLDPETNHYQEIIDDMATTEPSAADLIHQDDEDIDNILKFSIHRPNFDEFSESEESSDGDEDENEDLIEGCLPPQTQDTSSSGYGSGSGSLADSPLPNLKELDLDRNLTSSSEQHKTTDGAGAVPPRRRSSSDHHENLSSSSEERETPATGSGCGGVNHVEVAARIVAQVESMFSDEHLAKDGFLLKHVRRRSDGFVSLKLVAGLRKVKQISREFLVVLDALKTSDALEVNPDGSKVRRRAVLPPALKSMVIKQAKKDKRGRGGDKEVEKENQSEQQLARRRHQKDGGYGVNEFHYDRGNQGYNYQFSTTSRRSSTTIPSNEFLPPPPFRRRGGSLPFPPLAQSSTAGNYYCTCPPNDTTDTVAAAAPAVVLLRPKSNSDTTHFESSGIESTGMSSWLQKRKASNRLSIGEVGSLAAASGVIRQPRGPDGTKGFHPGYRAAMQEERRRLEATAALN